VCRRSAVTGFLVAAVAVGLDLSLFTQLLDAPDQISWVSRDIDPALILNAGANPSRGPSRGGGRVAPPNRPRVA
jgi:hypothetical protein